MKPCALSLELGENDRENCRHDGEVKPSKADDTATVIPLCNSAASYFDDVVVCLGSPGTLGWLAVAQAR
jgi:hypothetical protein